MTVYLNINLVRNIDIFCIDETKLHQRFLNVNFIWKINSFPLIGKTSSGHCKLVYVKIGIIAKRLENAETKSAEATWIEVHSFGI